MVVAGNVSVRPINRNDLDRVGDFLHREMNARLSAREWTRAVTPPWPDESPNHGFMLTQGEVVLGVNVAFYSERDIRGQPYKMCNLAALCVREDARSHTFRLVRSLITQREYHFTDLSPSGNVVELNRRLGFQSLDTRTLIVPNLPRLRSGYRIVSNLDDIGRLVRGTDAQIFADHRLARAARHVLVQRGADYAYVIFRKDRRKRLPVFASLLHVSHADVFRGGFGAFSAHLFRHHGVMAVLVEQRVVEFAPLISRALRAPRAKAYKSSDLSAQDVDYLYSELTCVPW